MATMYKLRKGIQVRQHIQYHMYSLWLYTRGSSVLMIIPLQIPKGTEMSTAFLC